MLTCDPAHTADRAVVPRARFVCDGPATRVVFGRGCATTDLAPALDRLAATRVLLIASEEETLLARCLAQPFASSVVATFVDVRPHVPLEVAQAARQLAARAGADAVLSIGGGSTTGTAKAVALTTGLPVVAVPTTYAGSEVTPVWGLTEGAKKTTGRHRRVLPAAVVYDPDLTHTLPAALSAASGLNALAHCLEAFWAAGANPPTSLLAEEGVRALAAGLPAVAVDPEDADARFDALYGAYLAGSAFAVAGSDLHHKICHVLGGAFDLPHAHTHAVVLPHVLALRAPSLPDVEARIARALGASPGGAVEALVTLSDLLGAPSGLHELGLPEHAVEEAVGLVLQELPPDGRAKTDRAAIAGLIRAAWRGTPKQTR